MADGYKMISSFDFCATTKIVWHDAQLLLLYDDDDRSAQLYNQPYMKIQFYDLATGYHYKAEWFLYHYSFLSFF